MGIFEARRDAAKRHALAKVRDAAALLDLAFASATRADPSFDREKAPALVSLKNLELEVKAAGSTKIDWEELGDRADAVGRQRFYYLPAPELKATADAFVRELGEWRIPQQAQESAEAMRKKVVEQADSDLASARAEMYQLADEYDYWDWYIGWYFGRISVMAGVIVLLFLAALITSAMTFELPRSFWAFLLGGSAGACLSILFRLPTQSSVYGEVAPLFSRIFIRLAGGVAGSALGFGFLLTGWVTITLPEERTLASVMQGCAHAAPCATDAEPRGAKEKAREGHAAVHTSTIGARPARSSTVATKPKAEHDAKGEHGKEPRGCPPWAGALLFSVGILFGFSERLIGSVEESIFGKAQGGEKKTEKPQG